MGDIKRRNRSLPQHPDMHIEGFHSFQFFEQIIRDEVDRVIHKSDDSEKVHHYPPMTSDMANQIHRVP
jgi:hypothetical protein